MVEIGHLVLLTVLVAIGSYGETEFVPMISDVCKEQGYCEFVVNYPTEQVEKVIAELGDTITLQNDTIIDPIDYGRSHDENEVDLCGISDKVLLFPEALQDRYNNWHIVLNNKNGPAQGFHVELCTSKECGDVVAMQEGYTGACVQKFTYRTVATLDRDGTHTTKSLRLPSCCSCVANTVPFHLRLHK